MQKDYELIKKYQNGDQKSFEIIVKRHLSNTIGFFFTITNDRMVAEMKYLETDNDYEPENLRNVIDKELDHDLSVKLGGDSFIDNLNFIPRDDNRRKGAN